MSRVAGGPEVVMPVNVSEGAVGGNHPGTAAASFCHSAGNGDRFAIIKAEGFGW